MVIIITINNCEKRQKSMAHPVHKFYNKQKNQNNLKDFKAFMLAKLCCSCKALWIYMYF